MTWTAQDIDFLENESILPADFTDEEVTDITSQRRILSSTAPPLKHRLPEHANDIERSLGQALARYRSDAEDILHTHMEVLERAQAAHELELANLRAENHGLRERLGVRPAEASQCVLFQANAESEATTKDNTKNNRGGTRILRDGKKSGKQRDDDDDEDGPALNSRKNRGKGVAANAQPVGSWQQFIAWIPDGASLQQPAPWTPLPDQCLPQPPTCQGIPPPLTRKKSKYESAWTAGGPDFVSSSPQGMPTGVVPGSVQPGIPLMQLEDQKRRIQSPEATKVKKMRKVESESSSESNSNESNDDEIETFDLLEVWHTTAKEKKRLSGRLHDAESQSGYSGDTGTFGRNAAKRSKPWYIINPDSNLRITWDLLSLLMVVYDTIMIPMDAFNISESMFFVIVGWTTRLFWTFDMGWSCCTGVVCADGSVDIEFRSIVKRYVRSWLALDVIIVGSDWSGLALQTGGLGLGRLARVTRVVRVVRLLRLVRMQEVIASIIERIQSDTMLVVVNVVKLLLFVGFCSHVIACGWWAIGARKTNEPTWASQSNYDSAGIDAQYLVSMHWGLSQFSGGMDEIFPRNTLERFYAVGINLIGFMASMVMLSTLTSSLTQQYIISGSGARHMATLRKYLKQNNVSNNLAKRLCRNAKHAVSGDLMPDAVDLLAVISEPLKIEMNFELYSRILAWHPFFSEFLSEGAQVMRRVCHSAMSMLVLADGDIVFGAGEEPEEPKMYIVVEGKLHYKDEYGEECFMGERQWAAEACLWTAWRHRGTLTAVNDVKVAMLDAEIFQDICKRARRKQKAFSPKRYASEFLQELNNNTCPSDLVEQ